MKTNDFYEARIYIGSREGYNGPKFTKNDLIKEIAAYQSEHGLEVCSPVRIAETCYLWSDYLEEGWEIGIINYPRMPKPDFRIKLFACNLAQFLVLKFKQNRISVVLPDEIIMFESDNPQEKHN